MDKTLVMIKPDGIKRGLMGEIISRFEKRGYQIHNMKLIQPQRETVEKHYQEHQGKDFFQELVQYILEGPLLIMEIEGENIVAVTRSMIGDKNPEKAAPGTIRGDYANNLTQNIIHASDSQAAAEREIPLWFS